VVAWNAAPGSPRGSPTSVSGPSGAAAQTACGTGAGARSGLLRTNNSDWPTSIEFNSKISN
jgi:hypothetical protein